MRAKDASNTSLRAVSRYPRPAASADANSVDPSLDVRLVLGAPNGGSGSATADRGRRLSGRSTLESASRR
jgi:hypothetical protein